jgi:7-cyano-7-deazaguanine synthase
MKKGIILLSGGLDSAVTLYIAKDQGYETICLTFNYQQKHKREIDSSKKLADLTESKQYILDVALETSGSSLMDEKQGLPEREISSIKTSEIPSTYVPARNIIFLSYALSYGEILDAESIFIGINQIDYSGYPDCGVEFIESFKEVSHLGTKRGIEGNPIKIKAPLINKRKSEIIKIGSKLRVPFEYTWSCYKGQDKPCRLCDSCKLREKAFREAGLKDPLLEK